MKQVKKMYELKFFVYFIVSYLGEVLCLYQINKINWIPGYTTACIVFIEMMFYCYVGTQLSIMDDKMCLDLQQTDWYSFDLHSQKMVQKMLHLCQQPNQISLKPLGTLNMVTGIQIVKGIYTYYTLLTELF
ncbi:uncharacterized protein LOC119074828 [Bradysia coprophila]|uniref:uncharacterized protein LOC119074828 n=1 Tax=Bradysia coprophila TaxID=38358 RepID=UPI00187DD933|nr:uncharacterized protein LOC119074828 [Bradysia coprophila]